MVPCNVQGNYRIGNVVWFKILPSKCIDKLRMGHVTEVISPQSVGVDDVPRHVTDLWPVVGLKLSLDDESDSEDSARLVYLKSDALSVASDIKTISVDANVASCSDADG